MDYIFYNISGKRKKSRSTNNPRKNSQKHEIVTTAWQGTVIEVCWFESFRVPLKLLKQIPLQK